MADANAVELQRAINRYAVARGVRKISMGGVIGPETLAEAKYVLGYIAVIPDDGDEALEAVADQAATLQAKATLNVPTLAVKAAELAGFLNYAANLLKLPQEAAPPVRALVPAQPARLTLFDRWKALATWQKVAIGALFGFGALWLHRRYTTRSIGN